MRKVKEYKNMQYPAELIPGDWFKNGLSPYSSEDPECVVWNNPQRGLFGATLSSRFKSWTTVYRYSTFIALQRERRTMILFIGHTKRRWWWKFLPGINSWFCPFPQPPRARRLLCVDD